MDRFKCLSSFLAESVQALDCGRAQVDDVFTSVKAHTNTDTYTDTDRQTDRQTHTHTHETNHAISLHNKAREADAARSTAVAGNNVSMFAAGTSKPRNTYRK